MGWSQLPGQVHTALPQVFTSFLYLSSHSHPSFANIHLLCPSLSDPRLLQFLSLVPYFIPDLVLPHPLRLFPKPTLLLQDTIRPPISVPRSSQAFAQEQLPPPLYFPQQPHDFHSNILQIPPALPNCLQCPQVPLTNSFPKKPLSTLS